MQGLYYEVLGLDKSSGSADVELQYVRAIQECRTWRGRVRLFLRRGATRSLLLEARDVLIDVDRRAEYDSWLEGEQNQARWVYPMW